MRDARVGRILREVRVRKGWRQVDVARRAGVSQRLVAEVEAGRIETVTVQRVRRIGAALDVNIEVDAWWQRGDVDRLMDRGHAALVELVMRTLGASGWIAIPEVTFNHWGERGSADIVAWHAATRTLLIIEVKTRIGDVQELHATFARKVRILPARLEREHGWQPLCVASMLVVVATHGARAVVARHQTTFDAMWPERSVGCRRFVARPSTSDRGPGGSVRGPGRGESRPWGGIWFVDPRLAGVSAGVGAGSISRVRCRPRGSAKL